MSTSSPVSRRYARALLELGIERGTEDAFREQLLALGDAFSKSKDLRHTMLNPSIELASRKAILDKIATAYRFDPMLRNFTQLLLDKGRFSFIQDIAAEYQRMTDVRAGRVHAHITSAKPLGLLQQTQIRAQIKEITAATDVSVEVEVDPALLGGLVTRVGGLVLDGSVLTQLEMMRSAILSEV